RCLSVLRHAGDGVRDAADELHDAWSPATGDVVVEFEDRVVLHGTDRVPARPFGNRLGALVAAFGVRQEDHVGIGGDDPFLTQLRRATGGFGVVPVGDVLQAEAIVDVADEGGRRHRVVVVRHFVVVRQCLVGSGGVRND